MSAWATRQITFATCEAEIRAAMRVLLQGPHEPLRMFILKVRRAQPDVPPSRGTGDERWRRCVSPRT